MVPFGLAQTPAYFQLLMNKVCKGLKFTMTYLDDIIIFSENELQHLEHLETVFSQLREDGLKMKRSKCDFFKSKIHYLGQLISPEGISPLPNKLDCIKHMPMPKDVKEIKQLLGLTGYYRKFVPRFADISRPLTTLTKKDKKLEWTAACQKSFDLLKETLCGEPVLKYADTSKPYTLYTDASKFSWAGVLTQSHTTIIDGKLKHLQQQDANIETLKHKLQHNKLDKEYYSIDENELLTRKVVDGGHKFCAIYLPNVLVFQVLQTAHDDSSHNGFPRTYAALKRVFYWKGMKEDIRKHCKTCATYYTSQRLSNLRRKFSNHCYNPWISYVWI